MYDSCFFFIPEQVGGVPSKPTRQAQAKDPGEFVQLAPTTSPQPPLSTAHSFMSVLKNIQ